MIYKILTREQWKVAKDAGVFTGAPVDIADGFIHFSAAHQLAETARLHFAGMDDLIVVGVRAKLVENSLRWEKSRGGEDFPHLYAELAMEDVAFAQPLVLDASGRYRLPPEIHE